MIHLVLGNALHHRVFPRPPPDPATFPRPGDEFGSTFEGFHQGVLDVVDGWAAVELEIAPGAGGGGDEAPPGSRRAAPE